MNQKSNQESSATSRRDFLKLAALGGAGLALSVGQTWAQTPQNAANTGEQPNILWITIEDLSPILGCYGDTYARTPNIDRLATQGIRYNRAFAPAPVCAPARSSLATGVYACSLGSQNMRSHIKLPPEIKVFSEYLRGAGYYCTNNVKTDYNFPPPLAAWDESSARAHWRKRPEGKPFFSVFNFMTTHESKARGRDAMFERQRAQLPPEQRHDPAQAPLPPYYPDAPEIRQDIARYYDNVSRVDAEVGRVLSELEADGLADNTIVFFFSDHGTGMPRSKRSPTDSGLRVPLLVRFPPKYQHLAPSAAGSVSERLVNFVDFGATVLNLANVPVPSYIQGKPFLGRAETLPPAPAYVYGFRDRMDARYDCQRTVTDGHFRYTRNFMPHLPAGQHNDYMFVTPTTRVWERMYREGKTNTAQSAFWQAPKAVEELYDTQADPHEINNLAAQPEQQARLVKMRGVLRQWMLDIRDLGLMAESDMNARFGDVPFYTAVRQNPKAYDLQGALNAAAIIEQPDASPQALSKHLKDADAAARFQAVLGLLFMGKRAASEENALRPLLQDREPAVQSMAAEWLGTYSKDASPALNVLVANLSSKQRYADRYAANALDHLDERARPAMPAMRRTLDAASDPELKRVLVEALAGLGEKVAAPSPEGE